MHSVRLIVIVQCDGKFNSFMTRILILLIATIISVAVSGQNATISSQDSVMLDKFWTELKVAINTNDKAKLATLCDFSFYCRPCIDDTTLKKNNHVTIKVTKALFYESQYKLFYDKPFKDKVNSYDSFKLSFFYPAYDDNGRQSGFSFSYAILAPSERYEGIQGFVYVDKVKGQYKITGIDTVP